MIDLRLQRMSDLLDSLTVRRQLLIISRPGQHTCTQKGVFASKSGTTRSVDRWAGARQKQSADFESETHLARYRPVEELLQDRHEWR
jgi:hypothetical protein